MFSLWSWKNIKPAFLRMLCRECFRKLVLLSPSSVSQCRWNRKENFWAYHKKTIFCWCAKHFLSHSSRFSFVFFYRLFIFFVRLKQTLLINVVPCAAFSATLDAFSPSLVRKGRQKKCEDEKCAQKWVNKNIVVSFTSRALWESKMCPSWRWKATLNVH